MSIGCCQKVRFCKENNLFPAPAQLCCLSGILAEPKKALFLLVLCPYTIFFLLEAFCKGSGNGCVLLMDVGTGRSGEGVFPPVPQQAQAGFGAGCPTTHPESRELPSL